MFGQKIRQSNTGDLRVFDAVRDGAGQHWNVETDKDFLDLGAEHSVWDKQGHEKTGLEARRPVDQQHLHIRGRLGRDVNA